MFLLFSWERQNFNSVLSQIDWIYCTLKWKISFGGSVALQPSSTVSKSFDRSSGNFSVVANLHTIPKSGPLILHAHFSVFLAHDKPSSSETNIVGNFKNLRFSKTAAYRVKMVIKTAYFSLTGRIWRIQPLTGSAFCEKFLISSDVW